MKGRTPQQRIEDWILTHDSYSNLPDVNETLILYKGEQVTILFRH